MNAFHSFIEPEFGLDIRGPKTPEILAAEARAVFRFPVAGKTVLDIGAWDGWFTFEAERRGAEVTASDWYCWGGPGWGTREVFDHVHAAKGSKAKIIETDIPNLNPEDHGRYDVVFLLGVLYHVPDMLNTLRIAQHIAHERLVIETVTHPSPEPVAKFWKLDTLGGDGSNYWVPSVTCVADMMAEFGFTHYTAEPTPDGPGSTAPNRHIMHFFRE